jgi:dual specificity tyrosine-phosphorylation-regulated kinase 2/3/4
MATPEYMPPEILNYIMHENNGDYEEALYLETITNYRCSWAVDIWSLGCVLLELLVGVPLWMSLPLLVTDPSTAELI